VGAVAPEVDRFALALDDEIQMPRRVAIGLDGTDTSHDVVARLQEREPIRDRLGVGSEHGGHAFELA